MTIKIPAPARHSLRLPEFDYSQEGGYFVTIVARNRENYFGEINIGNMNLFDAGRMVKIEWEKLPHRFPKIELGPFQVMPNHFHGIIIIHEINTISSVEAGLVPALPNRATTRVAPTLGEIIGAFKSITTVEYIKGVKKFSWPEFSNRLWQRNYYEHIIRNNDDYECITAYIRDNPINWDLDEENDITAIIPSGKRG
jgi:putative transposase